MQPSFIKAAKESFGANGFPVDIPAGDASIEASEVPGSNGRPKSQDGQETGQIQLVVPLSIRKVDVINACSTIADALENMPGVTEEYKAGMNFLLNIVSSIYNKSGEESHGGYDVMGAVRALAHFVQLCRNESQGEIGNDLFAQGFLNGCHSVLHRLVPNWTYVDHLKVRSLFSMPKKVALARMQVWPLVIDVFADRSISAWADGFLLGGQYFANQLERKPRSYNVCSVDIQGWSLDELTAFKEVPDVDQQFLAGLEAARYIVTSSFLNVDYAAVHGDGNGANQPLWPLNSSVASKSS